MLFKQRIFLILAGHATSEDLDGFLREAVSLNRAQILYRLRSRHAKYRCNYSAVKKLQPRSLPLILRVLGEQGVQRNVVWALVVDRFALATGTNG